MFLTNFFIYCVPSWPGFCIGSSALIIASGPDQSNDELSMPDSDDGSVSPDSSQDSWMGWLYN